MAWWLLLPSSGHFYPFCAELLGVAHHCSSPHLGVLGTGREKLLLPAVPKWYLQCGQRGARHFHRQFLVPLPTAPRNGHYSYPKFTDEKTETKRVIEHP